jgi:hypothetical protein
MGTMTVQQNQEASRDQEVVYYPPVNGRFGRIFATVLLGMLTAAFLWLPFLMLNQLLIVTGFGFIPSFQDPSAPWPLVAVLLIILTPCPLMFGWFTARFAVHGKRSARGRWWLRLSSTGFEVNDRLVKPRRIAWCEIDKFMLVAPSAYIDDAAVAPRKHSSGPSRTAIPGIMRFALASATPPGIVVRSRTSSGDVWPAGGATAMGQKQTALSWAIGTAPSMRRSI